VGVIPRALPCPAGHALAKHRRMEDGRQRDRRPAAAGHRALVGCDQSLKHPPHRRGAPIPHGPPPATTTSGRTSCRCSTTPTWLAPIASSAGPTRGTGRGASVSGEFPGAPSRMSSTTSTMAPLG
jgi:hypothetical protein